MAIARALPSQARLRECFDYDQLTGALYWHPRPLSDFTLERIWKAWSTRNLGRRAGFAAVSDTTSYWYIMLNGRLEYQHRVIWKWMTDEHPPMIDHRDLDGLNNTWTNLRLATKSQNAANTRRHRDKLSDLPKGVSRKRNGFQAEIQFNNIRQKLGQFHTPEEAHAAYCEAAWMVHGVYSRLD